MNSTKKLKFRASAKLFLSAATKYKQKRKAYNDLKKANFEVTFTNDDSVKIQLPEFGILRNVLKGELKLVKKLITFSTRNEAEPLLRWTVTTLIKLKAIEAGKSVIDIGSWIGDNTIPWSLQLGSASKIFAIDPSEDNLKFAEKIAINNKIENVEWISAVCMSKPGILIEHMGDLDHASFQLSSIENQYAMSSTSLDFLIPESFKDEIGFIHLDVEGSELEVIKGASEIIEKSMPIVIFECHIKTNEINELLGFFVNKKYKVFMINEVLENCNLDCRNFLALPSHLDYLENQLNSILLQSSVDFFPAYPEKCLLSLPLQNQS